MFSSLLTRTGHAIELSLFFPIGLTVCPPIKGRSVCRVVKPYRARDPGFEPGSCHLDFRDFVYPASKSRCDWKIVLKCDVKSPNHPANTTRSITKFTRLVVVVFGAIWMEENRWIWFGYVSTFFRLMWNITPWPLDINVRKRWSRDIGHLYWHRTDI